jgi:hypothetical protein
MAIDKIIVEFQAETTKLKKELDDLKGRLGNVETKAQQGGKNITKSFDNAGTGVNKLSANLKNLAGTLGLALGAQEVIRFTKQTIDAASDLNETVSKSQQIFGTASKSVEQFASNSAKQFGMSKKTAIDAAASFGTFGKAAGLTGEDLGTFSTDLVALSADLASFGNTTPEEAALALGAALRGEAEPIRKFGVLLDDATLKQEALAMGLIETTKSALTPQQKVLAANAVILKQTSDAQGDFAKTSGGAANQQRIMSATLEDIQTKLGEKLLPAFQQGIQTLNEFATAVDWNMVFGELGEIFDSAAEPIRQLYSSLADIFEAFTQNMSAGEKTAGVFDALGVAINVVTTPMRVISKLFKHLTENIIVPLIETGQDLITWFNEVREGGGFVGAIFNGIASAAGAVIDKLEDVAQFIGIIDSDEEKLHKNRMQRDADFKKSNEEYAARNFKQQKQRTKDEERIMALKAKTAYLGQKLTKEEEAELKKLTAATAANTDKTKGDTKAKEIAKTAVEKLNEELGKLKTAQENATFAGDIEKASEYQKAISKLENQLAIFKNTLEEVRGGIVGDEDLEALEIESNLSLSAGVDALIAAELSKLKEDLGTFTDEDPIELPVILTIQEKAKQDALKKVGEIETKMGEVFGAVNSVLGPAMDALNGYFDLRLNNLEKEKNERLANENLTAEERLRIEEEYEAKKNAILAEQFEVSRGSQIIQAIMSSAQAALNAFTSTALLFAPAAPAAAAAAAAFGAVQIGIIAAQPNPYKFFEGTPYLQLGGNPKGKDTIPVMAHEGEAIIPTGKNLQYPGLAKSWIDGNLDKYINKNFVRPALMEQQRQAEEDFADRLAASMALQMSSNFDDYRLFRATKEQTAVLRDGFQTMKQTRKKLRGA